MSAEKEPTEEASVIVFHTVTLERIGADGIVDTREYRIDQEITCKHQAEELCPSDTDHIQIRMDISPTGSAAPDIEASILINGAPQNTADLLCKARVKSGFAHFRVFSSLSSVRIAGRTCSMLDLGSRRS